MPTVENVYMSNLFTSSFQSHPIFLNPHSHQSLPMGLFNSVMFYVRMGNICPLLTQLYISKSLNILWHHINQSLPMGLHSVMFYVNGEYMPTVDERIHVKSLEHPIHLIISISPHQSLPSGTTQCYVLCENGEYMPTVENVYIVKSL